VARIDVLTDRPIGTVDRRIFGSFTGHLGRCVYGGVFDEVFDEGSGLAGPGGFRADVLAAVRDLGVTNVRWPGGNFVSGYHWADGIGPDRPRRAELAWHSEESNRFGTDEFMAWCAIAGVEPVLCLNMGTGTLDEALAWVQYCNGTGDTLWAGRRRANGHAEPYRVRYWGLGNEMYGDWQIGQRTATEYVAEARRWAPRGAVGMKTRSSAGTGLK
jgi:alpha-L-arabinofuranosidase